MTSKSVEHSYDCIEAEQNGHKLYIFSAPAKEIFSYVSVNQKEEDKDEGYQRVASPSRTSSIARFLDAGNAMPLSLLITLEKRAATFANGKITIKGGKKSGWVIDGQHRLIGATQAKKEITLPVVAFIGLSLSEQVQQFVTVNKEAKGVPSSLYISLLKKLPPKLSPAEMAKERAADIAISLRNNEISPFFTRIVSATSPKNGQLSLVNFVRKVGPLVREDGLLGAYSLDEQIKIIDNFYQSLKNVFPKDFQSTDPVFFQTIGFGAAFNFFQTLFSATLKEKKSFTIPDVTEMLQAVSHFDIAQWKKNGTGNAAEIAAGKDIIEEFRQFAADSGTHSVLKLV